MIDLLKVDSLEVAINKLYNEIYDELKFFETEDIDICDSLNRILAEDLISKINVPGFDRSTVDGYAVIASDTNASSETVPVFLNIIGESIMGEVCDLKINNGECVYVPTGAMLPKNANACVMIENTESITDKKIAIYESVGVGKSVIKANDDTKINDVILKKGRVIKPQDIGYISSIGIKKIKVYKKWNVSIISTGDELISLDEKYSIGKIRDINTNMLYSLSIEYGFNVIGKCLVKDSEEVLKNKVLSYMDTSNIVIISGGSSKGKKDASSNVINSLVSTGVLTHGIAIKPGKPTITGYDNNSKTIVIGLPGHPVASHFLFKFLIYGLYKKLLNINLKENVIYGKITENLPASPGRMTIQLVNIDKDLNVKPIFARSGIIHSLSNADGYLIIDKDSEGINIGEIVKVYYL